MASVTISTYGSVGDISRSGGTTWTNIGNLNSSGYAECTKSCLSSCTLYTNYLSGSNPGFSIPSTATINGIVLAINHYASSSTSDLYVEVKKSGVISSPKNQSPIPTSPNTDSFGSPTDLWGETWTPSDINSVYSGFRLYANVNGDAYNFPFYRVYSVSMTVYYTTADFAQFGTTGVSKAYYGSTQISKIYLGTGIIYEQ